MFHAFHLNDDYRCYFFVLYFNWFATFVSADEALALALNARHDSILVLTMNFELLFESLALLEA